MRAASRNDIGEKRKPSVFKRILAVLLITVLLIAVGAYGTMYVVMNGPSEHARSQFIDMACDSGVGTVVLHLFLSPEMIDEWQKTPRDSGSDVLYSVYPQPE